MGDWPLYVGKLIYVYYGYADQFSCHENWQGVPWVNMLNQYVHEGYVQAKYSDARSISGGQMWQSMQPIQCVRPANRALVYRVGFIGTDGCLYETHVQHQY
eukprot:TRINITY_DN4292_c0_g1_i11.p1 TRINITY_DN4292_c0_g1~~TRINITY_DN4292_c0_g1_i11.p1  ORF type:complete len:101 (-),score=6.18 TRINITY_DN4292_c0_g1_i11:232-534(-)